MAGYGLVTGSVAAGDMVKPLVDGAIDQDLLYLARASVLFYRTALPLSRQTLNYAAGVIRRHRRAMSVVKRQKRLAGVDELVISLAARGLTTGDIAAHPGEVYGAQVSRQTISTITDAVIEGMTEWQNR